MYRICIFKFDAYYENIFDELNLYNIKIINNFIDRDHYVDVHNKI